MHNLVLNYEFSIKAIASNFEDLIFTLVLISRISSYRSFFRLNFIKNLWFSL